MCGLVYKESFNGEPVNNDILQQFDAQRSRGTQGFGLFDGQFMHMVRAAKEDKILKWLVKYDSTLLMFHHRNPTSTVNVKRAAHPFSTKDYFGDDQYVMIHNGHISNSTELFIDHQELGIEYQSLLQDLTFNDSEALLWDLALTLEGKQEELTARGGIAFVCIKTHKGQLDKLYFGRNSNPLKLHRDKDGLSLSSEGKGDPVDTQTLYTYNYKLKRLTKKYFKVPMFATYTYTGESARKSSWDNQSRSWDNQNSWEDRDSDYWDNSLTDVPGGWLPSHLRHSKAGKYMGLDIYDYDREGNIIGYSKDPDSGIYTPDDFEMEDDLENFRPTRAEVSAKAWIYMIQAKGMFEEAYWLIEDDYLDLIDDDNSSLKELLLLEEVMEHIESDPEYINPKSRSSYWSASWETNQLALS